MNRWRIVAATLGVLCALAAVLGVIAHLRAPHSSNIIGLSAFAPYLMLCAVPALVLLGILRWWVGVGVALLVTAIAVSTQWRLYVPAAPLANGVDVVTMTANLRLGSADPASVIAAVRAHHVTLLMTEELSSTELDRLIAAGLPSLLPHRLTAPRSSASGVGIWSAYPLRDEIKRTDFTFAFVTAEVAVPGVANLPVAVALHMPGPWPQSAAHWDHDIHHLPHVLPTLAPGQPVIVGGDFNATPDVGEFRDLLTDGYHDAAQQAGAGLTPTYPSSQVLPPLIAIDHVLTRGAVGRSAITVHIDHSDHRALVTTIQVPAG